MSMRACNKVLTSVEQAITKASGEGEHWDVGHRGSRKPEPRIKASVNGRRLHAYNWSQVSLGSWCVFIIQS